MIHQLRLRLQRRFGTSLALILLIFTLLPVLALLFLGAYTIRLQLENRSLAQLETIANLVDTEITQWAQSGRSRLDQALSDPVISQNTLFALQASESFSTSRSATVLANSLDSLLAENQFDNVYLIRMDGTILAGTSENAELTSLGVDFAALQEANQTYHGFARLEITGEWTILTWRPVLDRQMETAGFLVGELSLNGLTSLLRENTAGSGQGVTAYLLSPDGTVLTYTDHDGEARPQVVESTDAFFDAALENGLNEGNGTYSGLFTTYNSVPAVGAVRPLALPLNLRLVAIQPETEAFQLLYDAFPLTVVFMLGLTALAIVASVLTTRQIVTPLHDLEQAAQAMSAGELKTRVEISRNDEFGSLADSFNAMAGELETAFEELERSNDLLASRAEQLATITRVGQTANQFLDLGSLLATVVKQLQAAFDYQAVAIYLPDEDQSTLEARAVATSNPNLQVPALQWPIDGKSAVGAAAHKREVTHVTLGDDSAYAIHRIQAGTKSEANIPLIVGSENLLIGVLSIQSNQESVFSIADLEVLQILGNQIAIAIRNADLFKASEQARQMADEANRQKSDFLSNMSHELRTPLNVIIGYSHSILNRPAMYNYEPLPGVYLDAINSIMTSGQHLLGLINDILDLSKIEAGKIELNVKAVDPLPILQGVRATGLGLVKDGVEIVSNYRDDLPFVMGDELRIRQILLNLVSNAAKFTDRGFITLDAQVKQDQVVFSVIDTGQGIPDDVQPSLFTRFRQGTTTQTKIHGTGLGLSICRELTLMQGGNIWFTSKVGRGSAFHFSIPLAAPEAAEEMRLKALFSSGDIVRSEGSLRVSIFDEPLEEQALIRQILLVDVDGNTRGELQHALTEAGYNVMAVPEVDRAIALASALLPDLVLVASHGLKEAELTEFTTVIHEDESLRATPFLILKDADLPENKEDSEGWQRVRDLVVNALHSHDPVE